MADPRRPGPPHGWSDHELERALRELGTRLDHPPTPDIAAAVRRRLDEAPRPAPAPWWSGWSERVAVWLGGLSPRRAAATAALLLLLIGAAALALFPGARDTVAGWLGVRGIRIVFVEETPAPALTPTPLPAAATPAPLGANLLLGDLVTLDEAQRRVDFPLLLPDPARLGQPDEVYLRQRPEGAMVSFVYYPDATLPAAAETGVGLLFVQFEAEDGSFWFEKGLSAANETRVVRVFGEDALWLGGAHYLLIAPDPAIGHRPPEPDRRASASVLLWDEDGVTYRIEANISMTEAVGLAEGVTPLATPAATPAPTP